jgi:hypothetical protein
VLSKHVIRIVLYMTIEILARAAIDIFVRPTTFVIHDFHCVQQQYPASECDQLVVAAVLGLASWGANQGLERSSPLPSCPLPPLLSCLNAALSAVF